MLRSLPGRGVLLSLLVGWIIVAVTTGTFLEAGLASADLTGRCTKADAEGSAFDKGKTSVEWLPPAVRCSWDGRYPDDKWFPARGIGVIAVVSAAFIAVGVALWWIVRRAEHKHQRAVAARGS